MSQSQLYKLNILQQNKSEKKEKKISVIGDPGSGGSQPRTRLIHCYSSQKYVNVTRYVNSPNLTTPPKKVIIGTTTPKPICFSCAGLVPSTRRQGKPSRLVVRPFFDDAIDVVRRAWPSLSLVPTSPPCVSCEARLAPWCARHTTAQPHFALEAPSLPYCTPRNKER